MMTTEQVIIGVVALIFYTIWILWIGNEIGFNEGFKTGIKIGELKGMASAHRIIEEAKKGADGE